AHVAAYTAKVGPSSSSVSGSKKHVSSASRTMRERETYRSPSPEEPRLTYRGQRALVQLKQSLARTRLSYTAASSAVAALDPRRAQLFAELNDEATAALNAAWLLVRAQGAYERKLEEWALASDLNDLAREARQWMVATDSRTVEIVKEMGGQVSEVGGGARKRGRRAMKGLDFSMSGAEGGEGKGERGSQR
ncbi:hypothetical protein JCM10213_000114, partial [Rhodosporidiobolus nylandii]